MYERAEDVFEAVWEIKELDRTFGRSEREIYGVDAMADVKHIRHPITYDDRGRPVTSKVYPVRLIAERYRDDLENWDLPVDKRFSRAVSRAELRDEEYHARLLAETWDRFREEC